MALCHKLHKLLKHVKAWPILRSKTKREDNYFC